MPNNFLTPQIIARESLRILQANVLYKDLIDLQFIPEFSGKIGDVVNVRKREILDPEYYNGTNVTDQNINETSVPVKIDRWLNTSTKITSDQLALKIQNFNAQVLEPIMIGIAQKIDKDIAFALASFAGTVKEKTASPTNLNDIAALGKQLDKNLAPATDRKLVFAVDHKYDYALTDNLSKVNYAGDNVTLREALLGRVYSFDTLMSQNNPDSIRTSAAGTATSFKVAGTKGATTVALSTVAPATGTIKAGDKFVVNGFTYTFTNDVTATSASASNVAITPALQTAVANTDKVTFINKPYSLAFHKECAAFVTVPLPMPEGGAMGYTANANNISVRVIMDWDRNTKSQTLDVDVMYGIAKLNDKLIVGLA